MHLSTGKNKPKPPRFKIGDICHHWQVVEYVCHGRTHPVTGREYLSSQHYYLAKCVSCGTKEIKNQNALNGRPNRPPPACLNCKTSLKATEEKVIKKTGNVPDFATMKW
jgi:hypothetical protein